MVLLTYAVDHRDPSEIVRPRVSMTACIEAFAAPERVDDFYSTALQAKSVAQKLVSWLNMCCSSFAKFIPPWERRSLLEDFRSHSPWKVRARLAYTWKFFKVWKFALFSKESPQFFTSSSWNFFRANEDYCCYCCFWIWDYRMKNARLT